MRKPWMLLLLATVTISSGIALDSSGYPWVTGWGSEARIKPMVLLK